MAHSIPITVVGNLTNDPELKYLNSGVAVVKFRIAVEERGFDRASNSWKTQHTSFLNVELWREAAENADASLVKGTRVIVSGGLRVEDFERKDGTRGTAVTIKADEVGPSTRFTQVSVPARGQGNGGYNNGNNGNGGYNNQRNSGGNGNGGYNNGNQRNNAGNGGFNNQGNGGQSAQMPPADEDPFSASGYGDAPAGSDW